MNSRKPATPSRSSRRRSVEDSSSRKRTTSPTSFVSPTTFHLRRLQDQGYSSFRSSSPAKSSSPLQNSPPVVFSDGTTSDLNYTSSPVAFSGQIVFDGFPISPQVIAFSPFPFIPESATSDLDL
ncbi:hypothetical protein HHK36_004602 [Tetracentron sinense]|uniref:Uncharacterized protein n=1 Tax=Tetracentron sinense TaxID=13715 RepID=A0A835DDN0_TETSI|nr:hypothetical protein HHK36_028787 [Tetracentron sinense]KAF8393820.1 hypothetical protein HHK36_020018 [Tetracentron sinense]KAF8396917.1 hypothetical protein HHK36_018552 [Tetracentron sinense]KAF8412042.1 hypothetical protein HHK36_004602 [Tetracentron sinense]